jgi:hypothetical protein
VASRAYRRSISSRKNIDDPLDRVIISCIIHFQGQNPESISCETCLDYKEKNCEGKGFRDNDCIRCMAEHSEHSIMECSIAI